MVGGREIQKTCSIPPALVHICPPFFLLPTRQSYQNFAGEPLPLFSFFFFP